MNAYNINSNAIFIFFSLFFQQHLAPDQAAGRFDNSIPELWLLPGFGTEGLY